MGVSCVIFSVNLLKAVRREQGETAENYEEILRLGAARELSPEGGAGPVYNTFDSYDELDVAGIGRPASTGSAGPTEDTDATLDEEEHLSALEDESEMSLLEGALRNFTDYLQVW